MIFGGAAQFGIFATIVLAAVLKFPLNEAAACGIIGAADGPTTIYVANKFAQSLLGPLSVAAYSYMSLVSIIQPPVIKALTTKKERMIRMPYKEGVKVSKTAKFLFPICVTLIAGIIAPISVALVGFLMFGNIIRECGVVERLNKAAQNELANLVTLLLGITIGSTMSARVVAKLALCEDKGNYLIMHAIGANVSGQIGSIIAGGVVLAVVGSMLGVR